MYTPLLDALICEQAKYLSTVLKEISILVSTGVINLIFLHIINEKYSNGKKLSKVKFNSSYRNYTINIIYKDLHCL